MGVGDHSVRLRERGRFVGAGRDGDDAKAVGSGAGDVERGVADHDRRLARVGLAGCTGAGAGDRTQERAVLGIGAEGALTGRKKWGCAA